MYKVMIVDDDYPTLEFLSEAIDWDTLDLELASIHVNGAEALERALKHMPDILITDIGMPKMNGIELTRRLKEKNSNLIVAILSCHNEFDYAQRALKLNVQDYILKETLVLDDLTKLLKQYRKQKEIEQKKLLKKIQMQNLIEKNMEFMKEKFIHKLINESRDTDFKLIEEAKSFGLKLNKTTYIPVLCTIQHSNKSWQLEFSEDLLEFAILNVIQETLANINPDILHFNFNIKESFIFYPYQSSIKYDNFEEIKQVAKEIESALESSLNLSMSFIVGEKCKQHKNVRKELEKLLNSTNQRFYTNKGIIVTRKENLEISPSLFDYSTKFRKEIKNIILSKDVRKIPEFVEDWGHFIKDREFAPEMVRDWLFKLLIDLKVELRSFPYTNVDYLKENLNKEIFDLHTLTEMKLWFIQYLKSIVITYEENSGKKHRKDILDACRYVIANLDKKISLEEVAGYYYLNPSYFSRLFKKEVGMSFVKYVSKVKMDKAKELLVSTRYSNKEICNELGYDNESYFIKIFKDHFNVTPMEYRNNEQNSLNMLTR